MGWKVRGKSSFPEVMCFRYCLAGRKRMEIVICQNEEDWERKIIPQGMESDLRAERNYKNYFHEKSLKYRNTSRDVHVSNDKA